MQLFTYTEHISIWQKSAYKRESLLNKTFCSESCTGTLQQLKRFKKKKKIASK